MPLLLVVDDEPVVLKFLGNALGGRGYDYLLAENGERGLALFLKFRSDISLVVSDVSMPRLNGPDMVREIRKLDTTVPIMFMTGYNPGLVIPIEMQTCASLSKPFTIAAFLGLVEHCLKG